MVIAAESRMGKTLAYARAHGVSTALEVTVNFVLPYAIYSYANGRIGAAPALMASSGPPVLWSIATFIRARKLDAISILVLSGIVLSLLGYFGGGGVKFLQLRENLAGGLVGLIFLGSAAIGRPLILQLSRAGSKRRGADAAVAVESLSSDGDFRRAMTVATLMWGFGLVGVCAVNCALVFTVTIKQYLLIAGPISTVAIGLLTAWTFWYVPRALRRAFGQRAMASDATPKAST
jgi:hypothetical protein